MTGRGSGPGTAGERGTYHAGLSPETVLDVAVKLTRDVGLTGWSLRDLASELGVSPSVIYHHVGGREALSFGVVDRVIGRVGLPTTVMPWREWFRLALFPLRPVLSEYPGVARWLLLHGSVLPQLVPVLDAGIASLQEAGFAEETAWAYGSMVSTAMTMIAADDRLVHDGEGPHDHEGVIRGLDAVAGAEGVSLVTRDLLVRFTGPVENVQAARDQYYRYVLERLMDGLEASLEGRGSRPREDPQGE